MTRPRAIDLKELLQDIGSHYDPYGEYKGNCPECGEEVSQTVDACPWCQVPIYWKGSKTWNELYLRPEGAVAFLKRMGLVKFRDGSEYHRWRRYSQHLRAEEISATIDYCRDQLRKRDGRAFGRALLKYVFNVLELKEEASGDTTLGSDPDPRSP